MSGSVGAAPAPQIDPANPNIHRWENGLILIHDFISKEEEAAMIAAILNDGQWVDHGRRQTIHFGPHFDYTTFAASETDMTPPPKYLTDLLPQLPVQDYLPDQFTVQYYPPGTGIPPHVDTHSAFGEALYSLSIGSTVPMGFRRCGPADAIRMRKPKRSVAGTSDTPETPEMPQGSVKNGADTETPVAEESWELPLPPRSLLLMMGPSRYGFTHKIRGRKFDQINGQMVAREGRYSITMRTVRNGGEVGCNCDFPGVCDARIREEEAMQSQKAQKEDS